jgi:hypothetical protein
MCNSPQNNQNCKLSHGRPRRATQPLQGLVNRHGDVPPVDDLVRHRQ